MSDLLQFPAKICYTAAGMLIRNDRVLLIYHKKLNLWLCPGGHIEDGELPHQAAEREFKEETGVKVEVYDPFYERNSQTSEYIPSPVETNLHWISQQNFRQRTSNPKAYDEAPLHMKGCEQHIVFLYLVRATGSFSLQPQKEEVLQVRWVKRDKVVSFDLSDDMRVQLKHGFKLVTQPLRKI